MAKQRVRSALRIRSFTSMDSINHRMKFQWRLAEYCFHCTTPFYIRDLNICRFWYPKGLLEPIPLIPRDNLPANQCHAFLGVLIKDAENPDIYMKSLHFKTLDGIFYRARTNHLKICMETQKTLNSQSSLEGKKWSWRNQNP